VYELLGTNLNLYATEQQVGGKCQGGRGKDWPQQEWAKAQ
jgi:hypothetical protein